MDHPEEPSRRVFLRRALALGAGGAGGGVLLSACGRGGDGGDGESGGESGGGGVTCDTSGLTQEEKKQRQRFQYVAQTEKPNERCNNCQFWRPDQVEGECGGCQLFPGPVNPKGWCNSWVQGSGS